MAGRGGGQKQVFVTQTRCGNWLYVLTLTITVQCYGSSPAANIKKIGAEVLAGKDPDRNANTATTASEANFLTNCLKKFFLNNLFSEPYDKYHHAQYNELSECFIVCFSEIKRWLNIAFLTVAANRDFLNDVQMSYVSVTVLLIRIFLDLADPDPAPSSRKNSKNNLDLWCMIYCNFFMTFYLWWMLLMC